MTSFIDEQSRMAPRRKPQVNSFSDAPSAIAKRFGVSAKALRVYEREGLIKPARTANGWRVYHQADVERLAVIVALKQLGLPLKRIAKILGGDADLAAALALQEAALLQVQAANEETLALVRTARRRLAQRKSLSTDELATLIRRSKMNDVKWTPKMEELAQKHYTKEQLEKLRARNFSPADQARAQAEWVRVYDDIDALGADADPASAKALAIGRRAYALVLEFTQGDPSLFKAIGAMKREMLDDPTYAEQAITSKANVAFLGKIFAELQKRGEAALN